MAPSLRGTLIKSAIAKTVPSRRSGPEEKPRGLADLIFPRGAELPARNFVALHGIRLREEGLHVGDEGLGDLRRQVERLAGHGLKLGNPGRYCESNQVPYRVGLE